MTFEMFAGLIGGLGLFIYGMHVMSDSLKVIAGNRMKNLLEVLTNNRFKAILVGAIVTVLVQSSSTTTVMVVGFVNASLMTLTQAAGIILGAHIGTTVMAQLIAFNVNAFAPLLVGLGAFIMLFAKKKNYRDIGTIIFGFGLIFFGISTMSAAMAPLKESPVFIDWLTTYGKNPILGFLLGAVITGIIQSSGASLGLLQALAIGGVFASVTGTDAIQICIPIMIGTNIGTCVTALLSSIGTSTAAKNAAFLHLFINMTGGIIILIVLMIMDAVLPVNPIYEFIVSISGTMTDAAGNTVPNVARQIAWSHTLFNVINTIAMLPIVDYFVAFLEKRFPMKEEEKGLQLDERLFNNPAVAIGAVSNEIQHMERMARKNLKSACTALLTNDEKLLTDVFEREKRIDEFERGLIDYSTKLTNTNLSEEENNRVAFYLQGAHDIERIGDHAENIAELAQMKINDKIDLSETGVKEAEELINLIGSILDDVEVALDSEDTEVCARILEKEDESDKLTEMYKNNHIKRVSKKECNAVSGVVFLDLLANLERVGDHSANLAKDIRDLKIVNHGGQLNI